MQIKKITSDKLVPAFCSDLINTAATLSPMSREKLYPESSDIFQLFHQAKNSRLLIATDYEGFNHFDTLRDFLATLPARPTTAICYINNVNKTGHAISFEIWHEKLAEFQSFINQVVITGKLDSKQLQSYIASNAHNLKEILQSVAALNEFNVGESLKILNPATTSNIPFACADNLTEQSLFGQINLIHKNNSFETNVAQLCPGYTHLAHGGYLIVKIDELLINPQLWFKLKAVLLHHKNQWHYSKQNQIQTDFQPDPAPLDLKVILLGDRMAISELQGIDRDITRLNPTHIEFPPEIRADADGLKRFFSYINLLQQDNQLFPITVQGYERIAGLCSRWCEHQNYVSIDEAKILQLLEYCHINVSAQGGTEITAESIDAVLASQHNALNRQVLLSNESILDKQVILETQGNKVGQINGLSVIEMDGHPEVFGEPVRITATGHLSGDGDFSDVERKAELAGNIHAKAMMIIQGFLTNTFANPAPLPLSANLVFEQSYHEIDGDSAALAGTCALLSALSQKPIAQHLAVTGAIDQFGNVLAVGGINEKIEGFYRVCKLNQSQQQYGVLIPSANIVNLNLDKAVVDAVTKGELIIYAINHIEEAVELLMGLSAGSIDDESSIYGIIQQLSQPEEEDSSTGFVNKIKQHIVTHCQK